MNKEGGAFAAPPSLLTGSDPPCLQDETGGNFMNETMRMVEEKMERVDYLIKICKRG